MKRKAGSIVIIIAFLSLFLLSSVHVSLAAEPYVLGYLTDITGVARANYAPDSEGFRLYMDVVNARGGINGHPVKVVVEDGKSDPTLSGAVAQKLIFEDKVLAIVGLGFSVSQPPVMALTKKEAVPVVTGYTCIEDVHRCEPGSNVFATGYIMHPAFHPGAYAMAKFLQGMNKPKGAKIALSGYTTPGARIWTNLSEKWCKDMGYEVVYREDIPPGTLDFSPWVIKIARLAPDAYLTPVGAEFLVPEVAALEKLGYTNDIVFPDFVPEGDLVKGVQRLVGTGDWLVWGGRYISIYDDSPEIKNIKDAMKKFGHQFPLSSRHCHGWTIGRLMEQALTKAGWPCTRAGLIAALEKTDLDTKGLTGGPIKFTPTDHYGPTWWKAYRWNASKKALVTAVDWFPIDPATIANK